MKTCANLWHKRNSQITTLENFSHSFNIVLCEFDERIVHHSYEFSTLCFVFWLMNYGDPEWERGEKIYMLKPLFGWSSCWLFFFYSFSLVRYSSHGNFTSAIYRHIEESMRKLLIESMLHTWILVSIYIQSSPCILWPIDRHDFEVTRCRWTVQFCGVPMLMLWQRTGELSSKWSGSGSYWSEFLFRVFVLKKKIDFSQWKEQLQYNHTTYSLRYVWYV